MSFSSAKWRESRKARLGELQVDTEEAGLPDLGAERSKSR